MYIIKNALRCIGRAKGRNILIGVIVLVIAVSACLGLSIRQAAESAKVETMEELIITATISYDRQSAMDQAGQRGEGGFNRENFAGLMGTDQSLTLEEYETYAGAESVKDFYYVISASLNGTEDLQPVSDEDTADDEDEEEDINSTEETDNDEEDNNGNNNRPNNMGGFGGGFGQQMWGAQSDFSIEGYSSDAAMTSFVDGTASVVDGVVFDENTSELQCIISEVLALYNNISVGDTITLCNPNNEEEVYEFKVVGVYENTAAVDNSFSIMGSTSSDPDNKIYTSYAALQSIVEASEESAETLTDENTGREFDTALTSSLTATYVFADADSYRQFEEDVRTLGLSEEYMVTSSDLTSFENSMVPLETLSTMAGYFLIVILIIGAIILVVLNVFNVRERKYEIGALTAMGMKKWKVALQFLTEIFVVTMVAVIIGAAIGAASSVSVTNTLLANQVASQNDRSEQMNQNFGRENNGQMGDWGNRGNRNENSDTEMPDDVRENMWGGGNRGNTNNNPFASVFGEDSAVTEYITQIDSAMNLTVVWQLLLIAVMLTLVSGAVSMLFIMRYDPLKILANRD